MEGVWLVYQQVDMMRRYAPKAVGFEEIDHTQNYN